MVTKRGPVTVEEVDKALIESVCARLRERLAPDEAARGRVVRPPVLPLGLAGGPAPTQRARPLRRGARRTSTSRACARRATRRSASTTRSFEPHGWQSTHTVVEIVTDDMPFLVDSVTMELNRRGLGIHLIIHPVMRVRRDADGELLEVLPPDATTPRASVAESVIHVEVDRETDPAALEALQEHLRACSARCAPRSRTGSAMRARAVELAAELDERARPPLDAERGRGGPGLPRLARRRPLHLPRLPRVRPRPTRTATATARPRSPAPGSGSCATTSGQQQLAPLRRAAARACARCAPRALPARPDEGELARDRAPAGLPRLRRRQALRRRRQGDRRAPLPRPLHDARLPASPREIPILRRKVEAVLDARRLPARQPRRQGAARDPRDVPARRAVPDRRPTSCSRSRWGSSHLGERQRVRLFVRRDPFGRFVSLPGVRAARPLQHREPAPHRARSCATRSARTSIDCTTRVSESVLVRLHYMRPHRARRACPTTTSREIEARLVAATRSWTDDLEARSSRSTARSAATQLFRRYGDAFPAAYRDDWVARAAVADVERHRGAGRATTTSSMSLYRPLEAPPGALRCKLFRAGGAARALGRAADVREHGRAGRRRAPVRGHAARRRAASGSTTSA